MAEETKFKYRRFYQDYIPGLPMPMDGDEEVAVCCPFHGDTTPSMHINLSTGLWNCKACDAGQNGGGGDIAAWLVEWYDFPLGESIKLQQQFERKGKLAFPMDESIAEEYHQTLLQHPKFLEKFMNKRGFTLNTIKQRQIGYDPDTQRYTIPVYSLDGKLINIRKYRMGAKKAKFINTKNAYTKSYLWPLDHDFINVGWVVIFEGETDAALARQLGIPSITQTGGAGQWPKGGCMDHYFRDKKVFICYDGDDAGRSGAEREALNLREVAAEVRICEYPQPHIDFTDFIVELGKTKDDFYDEVLTKSKLFVPTVEEDLKELNKGTLVESEFIPTSLSEATYNPAFNNKAIEIEAMIIGRSSNIFTAPKVLRVSVDYYDPELVPGRQCVLRSLTEKQLKEGFDINFEITRDTMKFAGVSDDKREMLLKEALGVPRNNNMYKFEEIESYNIEVLHIGPSVEKFSRTISDDSVDVQRAYHVYDKPKESVTSNRVYKLQALRTSDPDMGYVAYLVTKATPIREEMDAFKPTPEEIEELKIFQPADDQTVEDKMYEIASDLELYTRIWDRKELVIAYDLVYHSVLRFHLDNKLQARGWLELLTIGDPRTGKSETAEYMAEYYQAGDMIEVENTRLTGLTGTVQQMGNDQWTITWGKFPQNDRKLLILDEASGLSKDDFGAMSSMRSRGIVEINKAKIGQAYARTRSIWISNPRVGNGAKHMKDYPYGAKAIIDLVGRSEDIARFDFAMGVGRDEVDESIINRDTSHLPKGPVKYTKELCQRLIMWAWSRNAKGYLTPENDKVEFTAEAYSRLLKEASHMGREYDGSSLSIVERNSMKVKLSRLAVACAARLFSTDETYEKVIVKSEHVEFVANFLEKIYSNPTLGYRAMAKDEQRRHIVTGDDQKKIFRFFHINSEVVNIVDSIKGSFTSKTLEETLNIDSEEAKATIKIMIDLQIIYVHTGGNSSVYRVTHKWNEQLREFRSKREDEILQIIKMK